MNAFPRSAPSAPGLGAAVEPVAGVPAGTSGKPSRDEPPDWVSALSAPGPECDEALRQLHALMLRAASHQVRRMRAMLPGAGARVCDDIANGAADDALAALLGKLSTFEGRSRFTTWAYKFAILQAATEVRRYAWTGREISLDDIDAWSPATEPSPEQRAEASDLASAVRRALGEALTPYQRKIAVALLVDQVPIDVLADRLGTTRGALYKTLHMARGRLRVHLVASGHLPAAPEAKFPARPAAKPPDQALGQPAPPGQPPDQPQGKPAPPRQEGVDS